MKPKISIIIPVYNIDKYLSKCLDSIIAQTFKDTEIIVVNDGATDQSEAICDKYAKKDQRIKIIHKKHEGVSSARNIGIGEARGDYIGFVDGDDYIQKNMYKMLYELCIDTESDIAICKLGRKVDGDLINLTKDSYTKVLNNEESMRELFKGSLYRFSLCNKLFHKHVFRGIQFPEGRIHEDLSTTYKLFSKANQAVYTNDIGYIYVKRKNSILTSTYHEKRIDAFIGWNEILVFMKQNYPGLLEEAYACFGYWSVDNVYYILNQVDDKYDQKRYLKRIRTIINLHYPNLFHNHILTFKYKSIVTTLHYNVRLLLFINHVKRMFSRTV